jgi:hypothetical protein
VIDIDPLTDYRFRPSITTNSAGDVAIVVSEQSNGSARARLYFDTDARPVPPPPAPPTAFAVGTPNDVTVTWTANSADQSGFTIEYELAGEYHETSTYAVAGASERRVRVHHVRPIAAVRVHAFNAGGLSLDGRWVPVFAPRRRASGR